MAPKNKFTREEMVQAALQVVRAGGIDSLTAKTLADALGTSTQPVFTAFGSMERVRQAVYAAAVDIYNGYADAGLQEEIPFLGVGMQYIRFAREEPELYRFLFLTRAQDPQYSAMQSMQHLQTLVRPTLMRIYRISAGEADLYFRDLWLVVHSLSTLIVTGDCPYSDGEIGRILTGFSLSLCRSIKEIPGFAAGAFDRDALFRALRGKPGEDAREGDAEAPAEGKKEQHGNSCVYRKPQDAKKRHHAHHPGLSGGHERACAPGGTDRGGGRPEHCLLQRLLCLQIQWRALPDRRRYGGDPEADAGQRSAAVQLPLVLLWDARHAEKSDRPDPAIVLHGQRRRRRP